MFLFIVQKNFVYYVMVHWKIPVSIRFFYYSIIVSFHNTFIFLQNYSLLSTPDQTFSDIDETKDFLNIARSNDDSNNKINTNRNSADNYVANQIRLHADVPLTDTDPELTSLASQLAASYFNQFQNPMKKDMIELVKAAKQSVQDYIMETYGRKNPSGLSGAETFGITSPITGFTTNSS